MPTVFRNKTEFIYKTTGEMPGELQSKNPLLTKHREKEKERETKLDRREEGGKNQRVEYMAISKRLESKKEVLEAPTVDVSKFRKTDYIPPSRVSQSSSQRLSHFQSETNLYLNRNSELSRNENPNPQKSKILESSSKGAPTTSRDFQRDPLKVAPTSPRAPKN
jgi:hypothetical protein